MGDIVADWDPNTDLGVIAYGHRRKGDCSDIETVVPLGPANSDAIRGVVNKRSPKGKTPLSAAVQKAAQELRYTEERATVILVSDGKETCNLDPCAVGEELEKVGVDFTAHVIGFDISEDERAQLQCLAESTGGRYFDAQKADELKVALAAAVEQVQTRPNEVVAVLTEGGEPITNADIEWIAKPDSTGPAISATVASLTLPSESRVYSISARLGYASGEAEIEVTEGSFQQHVIVLNAGRLTLTATATGPKGQVKNPAVQWSIENLAAEKETANATGTQMSLYLGSETYGVFATYEGKTLDQEIRPEAGEQKEVSFEFEIKLANLEAPDAADIGEAIDITWEGPNGTRDYITIVPPDFSDNKYGKYQYTKQGSPLSLVVPDEPGVYELRYFSDELKMVLARKPIAVKEVAVTLSAPDTAGIGSVIDIEWGGQTTIKTISPSYQWNFQTVSTVSISILKLATR